MKEFLTLEEFLCPFDDRSKFHTSSSWVYLYRLAKASFEQFGEAGPPVGSEVLTLVNGHGGNGCDLRIFGGDYDGDFFKLIRGKDDSSVSLVGKKNWWREIVSINPLTVGWGELPKHIRRRSEDGLQEIVRFIVSN